MSENKPSVVNKHYKQVYPNLGEIICKALDLDPKSVSRIEITILPLRPPVVEIWMPIIDNGHMDKFDWAEPLMGAQIRLHPDVWVSTAYGDDPDKKIARHPTDDGLDYDGS